jgi:hypothetical protein
VNRGLVVGSSLDSFAGIAAQRPPLQVIWGTSVSLWFLSGGEIVSIVSAGASLKERLEARIEGISYAWPGS